jgi:hypothetical protein
MIIVIPSLASSRITRSTSPVDSGSSAEVGSSNTRQTEVRLAKEQEPARLQRAVVLRLTFAPDRPAHGVQDQPGSAIGRLAHSFTLVDGSSVHLGQDDIFHGGQMRKQIEAKVKNSDDVDKTLLRTMFER